MLADSREHTMRNALVALLVACGGQVATTSFEQADTVCGKGPTVQGIDVSYYQGTINWSAAIWASIIAGLVFAVLEVVMVPLVQGHSPWAPLHMIGAIGLGPWVLLRSTTRVSQITIPVWPNSGP